MAAEQSPLQPDSSSPSDWPDPLEAIDFEKTTEAVEAKAGQDSTTPLQDDGAASGAWSQDASQIGSPFLPDAKVEKRPLGRTDEATDFSAAVPELEHAPVLGGLAGSDSEMTHTDTAVPQQPLPVELGHEVMAIEADTSIDSPVQPAEIPLPEIKEKVPSEKPANSPSGTLRPAVTSIPQQYKVQPKAVDAAPGAIYDTATYHQPLAHPAKERPFWLWLIGFALILVAGAAFGAAVYFFGLA